MNKCVKITFKATLPEGFIVNVVQKHAKKLDLEGTAQFQEGESSIKIVICGDGEKLDEFIDHMHKGLVKVDLEDLEMEPFIKDRDFRGVFRVIE